MDNDRLAVYHPFRDYITRPVTNRNWEPRVIGMRGPYNCHREPFLPIGAHQTLFTGDFVSRVLPVRIGKRRGFGDDGVSYRPLIGGCRTDENVLSTVIAEQRQITLNICLTVGD